MLNDLRYALRLLVRSPGTTLAAVTALALGLGLSTAIFSAFNAVLLRPFPQIRDEHRVVYLNSASLRESGSLYELSFPDFLDLREQSRTLTGFTTTTSKTAILGTGDSPERVLGADISAEGFAMLGVTPVLGRIFTPADGEPGATPTAVLSHGLWQRRFGGRTDLIDQTEIINGRATTIIGVLPPGFGFPDRHELWTPLVHQTEPKERGSHYLPGWARLRDGVTLDEARAEIAALGASLALAHPATNEGKSFAVRLIRDEATAEVSLYLILMLGAAVVVLLIACANVANLLLAQATARSHEIAIRVALGATRPRLIRQVLTESLLLGLLGGGLGLLLGSWSTSLLLLAVPAADIPFWITFTFDWRVFAFAAGATLLSTVGFGLLPALQAARSTGVEIREGGRGATGSRRTLLLRQGLVVAQVALSAVLLISAGLFVRSFLKLQATPTGYDADGLLTFRVGLPPSQFTDREEVRRFFDELTPRLAETPGVLSAAATAQLPSTGTNNSAFVFEGQDLPATLSSAPIATHRVVTTDFFRTLRIPVVAGRGFADTDRRDTPLVAVVDQQFVRRWCDGQNPIGRRVRLGFTAQDEMRWMTIIGVVGDVPTRVYQPHERGALYQLAAQTDYNFISYVVRVQGDPSTYGPALQQAVAAVKPGIPIYDVLTLRQVEALTYWERRFLGQVFSAFGLGALVLAALGVYGVMAYSVSQRIPELGVRMALGASPHDVLRLVNRQGLALVALGLGIGLAAALVLTRFVASLLFGISPSDPPTYFVLTLVLAVVGLFASWLPARRATRVDPQVALRSG